MSMSRQSLESMQAETLYQVLPVVIAWAIEVAQIHLDAVQRFGDRREIEFPAALRAAFEVKFPDWATRPAEEKALMLAAASNTYSLTVSHFAQWLAPDPYAR